MRTIINRAGVICAVACGLSGTAYAQLSTGTGPISGYHGNSSDCTSCHTGGGLTASANISGPGSVLHGQNSGTFTLTGSGGTRRGFNIAIYRVSGNVKQTTGYNTLSAGIYSPFSGGELQHGTAETRTSWTFRWTAPATLGTYRVYACVNPVDNDGTLAGDGDNACDTYNFSVTNNDPNAINDTNAITVNEGSGLSSLFNVLSNDLTTEGDSFSWFSTSAGSVTGTLTDNSNGTYRYNPNGLFNYLSQGQIATTSFTYTIEEDSYAGYRDTATATIRISGVNDRPTAVNDGTPGSAFVTVSEGGAVDNGTDGDGANNDLASNDTDPDTNDNLDATRTACPAGVTNPANGTITNFGADGTFTYTHDGSNTTSDSFTYCTIDNSGTGTNRSLNSATVYIQITPVNDAPTITTSAGDTPFTEQVAVVVDSDLTLADSDSTEFSGATVQITGNLQPGDQLACGALPAGISCSAPGSMITLSSAGTSPIADYESALEAVTFTSSSDNPDLGARTVRFIVEDDLSAFSSPVATAEKSINPITRTNDSPSLAAIPNQVALEDTVADPFTFTYTAVASDPDANDDTNTGNGSLTYSLVVPPPGGPLDYGWLSISNAPGTPGQISGNPPQTGVFGQVYGPITVRVVDGLENGAVAATRTFNITVSPPDDDSDLVANYNDFCISVADGSNTNTDGDGTPGTDGPAADEGGDVCDSDDDDDGMPDTFELANSLNPLVDDAADDNDGDNISNLQEYLDGTNPNQENLVIDATGYLTAYELVPPVPTSIHTLATAVTANDYGPYRPGDNTITWTPSNATDSDLATSDPGNLVSNPPEQPLFIRPLVNLAVDQQAEENAAVMVSVMLNGDSPSWPGSPATVDYTLSGTAGAADQDAVAGTVTFNDGEYLKTINFNTLADAVQDPGETVVFTLSNPVNAAIGSNNSHTVTIVEGNVAPQVALQFTQGVVVGSAFDGDGAITVDALVSDVNGAQTHSYDWSRTDNALLPPGDVASWVIAAPAAGNYLVDVTVTDQGAPGPARATRMTRILRIDAGSAPALTGADSDGDGTPDNDAAEGYADDDGDGIPNYLDAIDGLVAGANLVPDQTVNASRTMMLQTESGLVLGRGSTAQAANRFGALLTNSEIEQYGDVNGAPPANPNDSQDHVGGIFDFEIRGLIPGQSASVVIPLQSGIPRDAEYRKFHPASGWTAFASDANNRVASTSAADGACPAPGSSAYRSGLHYLDNCIELTIQDGGPNDTDNSVNGVVSDPGSVGTTLTEPEEEEVEEGSSRMSPWFIAGMLLLTGFAWWRRRRLAPAGRG